MTQPRDIPGAKGKVMSWNDFSCGAALDFHDCALATLPEFHTDEPLTRHTRAFLPTLTSPGSALRHEQPGSGLRQWKEVSRSYTSPVTAHSSLGTSPRACARPGTACRVCSARRSALQYRLTCPRGCAVSFSDVLSV